MEYFCKNKDTLRKWAKEYRKNIDIQQISQNLIAILQNLEEYKKAKHIMIYYPLQDEINLLDLIKDKNKIFYLPKIHDKDLLCCKYNGSETLCESCFKTKEPLSSEVIDKSLLDLIIVPALCCDKNKYRLGYGKGFYDRFLLNSKAIKIACIPKNLLIETIYPNEFDIPMDKIVVI